MLYMQPICMTAAGVPNYFHRRHACFPSPGARRNVDRAPTGRECVSCVRHFPISTRPNRCLPVIHGKTAAPHSCFEYEAAYRTTNNETACFAADDYCMVQPVTLVM